MHNANDAARRDRHALSTISRVSPPLVQHSAGTPCDEMASRAWSIPAISRDGTRHGLLCFTTMRNIAVVVCAGALFACTDTYHPEYHPVTVTNVQQSVSAPVVVAPVAAARAQPTGVTPIVIAQPAPADPQAFFAPR